MTTISETTVIRVGELQMSAVDLQGVDLETALMAVQCQRANLLEVQLKEQMQEVQQRNAQIVKLNEALSGARELSARFSDSSSSSDKISSKIDGERHEYHKKQEWKDEFQQIYNGFSDKDKAIYNAKPFSVKTLRPDPDWNPRRLAELDKLLIAPDNCTDTGRMLEKMTSAAAAAHITLDVKNKGELTTAIENLKSMIDSQSNTQQMDMLRLQSLSNKRNEAFEVMTNFFKKMQDSRSSIVGNTR